MAWRPATQNVVLGQQAVQVHVLTRHRAGKANAEVRAGELVTIAFDCIEATIGALNANPADAETQAMVSRYFLTPNPSPAFRQAIAAILVLIRNGMRLGLTVKADLSWSVERKARTRDIMGYTNWHGSICCGEGHYGSIHIRRDHLMSANRRQPVLTVIHEASHKFADTADRGYVNDAGTRFKFQDWPPGLAGGPPAMTVADACMNADSYAWLCIQLGYANAIPPPPPP